MANFSKNSMAESWLTRMGVAFVWKSNMKLDQLHDTWNQINAGRPDVRGNTVLETNGDAVTQYASMFESGSSAPAAIIHKVDDGYEVLDGVLRLSAADLCGQVLFCAYEVQNANADVLSAIRMCANSNLNGKRANDDWTVSSITDVMIEQWKWAPKDCSIWSGQPVERFAKEMYSRKGKQWMESQGVDTGIKPANQKGFCTTFAKEINKNMRRQAADACVDIVKFCQAMKCNNGEADEILKKFSSIKRKPKVPLATQFNSKLDELRIENKDRLQHGTRRMRPVDKLVRAMATAVTIARNAGNRHADPEQAEKLTENLMTLKRLLRKIVPREDWSTESDIIV